MKKLPWGIKKLKPGVHKTIDAEKLNKFDKGFKPKRNKFRERQREEERKRKRREEETARLFEGFVQSFEADEGGGGRGKIGFVEGGSIGGTAGLAPRGGLGFSSGGSQAPARPTKRKSPPQPPPRTSASGYSPSTAPSAAAPQRRKRAKTKKKSEMMSFLEELKRKAELTDSRRVGAGLASTGAPSGARDDETTNIYVGSLAPQIDEASLARKFSQFGDIASVKIMWPRTQEANDRQHNSGFVLFMRRRDAEDAMNELQGAEWHGHNLRLDWGRKLKVPSKPLPVPGLPRGAVRNSNRITAQVDTRGNSSTSYTIPPNAPRITVVEPRDLELRACIDCTARYVARNGLAVEVMIMQRERDNPRFSFMFQTRSAEHLYYRWRVYSLAQGDGMGSWRNKPFQMARGGPFWIPPQTSARRRDPRRQRRDSRSSSRSLSPRRRPRKPRQYDGNQGRDSSAKKARDMRGPSKHPRLRERDRDELEDILRGLTLQRESIANAMMFALEHSKEAADVVSIIVESLTLDETPVPKKVARLYLASDILYNSTAPVRNASAYRTEFKVRLPDVFRSVHGMYRRISGRITANAVRERVVKVLRVWHVWSLYPEAFIDGLEAIFLGSSAVSDGSLGANGRGKGQSVGARQHGKGVDDDIDGVPLENVGVAVGEADIDGIPLDSVDAAVEAIHREPPNAADDDIDGVPMDDDDDDIDGVPVDDEDQLS